jgi:hypothetical protein
MASFLFVVSMDVPSRGQAASVMMQLLGHFVKLGDKNASSSNKSLPCAFFVSHSASNLL